MKKYKKVIWIKNLRIFEDVSIKLKTSLIMYNIIIHLENPFLFFQSQQENIPKLLVSKQMSYSQIKLGQISKLLLDYNTGIN